jgi:hypothetical protein
MEQLPNINKKYSIINFIEDEGRILVHFLRKNYEQWIDIPVENNLYITGLSLDNHIMSFAPVEKVVSILKNKPSNASYISSLVVNKYVHNADYLRKRDKLLARRNMALSSSDWTQLPDAQEQMTEEDRQWWKIFRQQLRDLTKQPGFPEKVNWPQRPHIMGTIVYE